MGVLEVKKLIGEGFMTPTRVLHVSGTCFCPKIAFRNYFIQSYAIFLKRGFFGTLCSYIELEGVS